MPKRKGRGGAKAARKKALGMSLVRNKRRVAQERRVAAKSGYVLVGGPGDARVAARHWPVLAGRGFTTWTSMGPTES